MLECDWGVFVLMHGCKKERPPSGGRSQFDFHSTQAGGMQDMRFSSADLDNGFRTL